MLLVNLAVLADAGVDGRGVAAAGMVLISISRGGSGLGGYAGLIAITAISLLIGGIIIMNIMLVSVTERTKEIGLRKSLGARRNSILWQVLVESMTLSSTGGLAGIALGFIAASAVSALASAAAAS